MIPSIDQLATIEVAAPVVVVVAVCVRLYFGGVVFAPRYTAIWNNIRRIAVPLLQRLIYQASWFPDVEIENYAVREEYVGVSDLRPTEIALRIHDERDVEVPLLSGFKQDWDGNTEDGTFVWYCGVRPTGFPKWLRPYQVHVTLFRVGERTRITAHYEANPWRPDFWADHLTKGDSFSVAKGVKRTERALRDSEIHLSETETDMAVEA